MTHTPPETELHRRFIGAADAARVPCPGLVLLVASLALIAGMAADLAPVGALVHALALADVVVALATMAIVAPGLAAGRPVPHRRSPRWPCRSRRRPGM